MASTAPDTVIRRASRRPATGAPVAAEPRPVPIGRRCAATDPALDEALERIGDLAARLWAVRSTHRPAPASWFRRAPRCADCGQVLPCTTLRLAG